MKSRNTPLRVAFWEVNPEIVINNLRRFETSHDEWILAEPTPEPYEQTLRLRLHGSDAPDIFYAQRGEAARWHALGLIHPLNEFTGLDKIRSRMHPVIEADSLSTDGCFLGLTYYNAGPFALFRNEKLLAQKGFSGTEHIDSYPQHWEDVEAQSLELKYSGLCDYPLLMRWFARPTGLVWNLIAQCHAEGETFVDKSFRAHFGSDTPIAKVLRDWRRWYQLGLVPPDLFSWTEAQIQSSWMSGHHAFHATLDYHAAIYSDPKYSRIYLHNHLNPVFPGLSKTPTLTGHALLCLSRRPRSLTDLDRVWSLLCFLGGPDEHGDLFVHRRWAREASFPIPFPEIYEEVSTRNALRDRMHPEYRDVALEWLLRNRDQAVATPLMRAPWYHDWDNRLHELIVCVVRDGSPSPDVAANILHALWEDLRLNQIKDSP